MALSILVDDEPVLLDEELEQGPIQYGYNNVGGGVQSWYAVQIEEPSQEHLQEGFLEQVREDLLEDDLSESYLQEEHLPENVVAEATVRLMPILHTEELDADHLYMLLDEDKSIKVRDGFGNLGSKEKLATDLVTVMGLEANRLDREKNRKLNGDPDDAQSERYIMWIDPIQIYGELRIKDHERLVSPNTLDDVTAQHYEGFIEMTKRQKQTYIKKGVITEPSDRDSLGTKLPNEVITFLDEDDYTIGALSFREMKDTNLNEEIPRLYVHSEKSLEQIAEELSEQYGVDLDSRQVSEIARIKLSVTTRKEAKRNYKDSYEQPEGAIEDVYISLIDVGVHVGLRRQGISKKLITTLKEIAKERGISRIRTKIPDGDSNVPTDISSEEKKQWIYTFGFKHDMTGKIEYGTKNYTLTLPN